MLTEVTIELPKGAEDIQVFKEFSLEDGTSIRVKVNERDEQEHGPGNGGAVPNVFLCNQDKVRKRFNPYDYACIETLHNHSVLLHPMDDKQQVLCIKVQSLETLLKQLERFGVKIFVRVSASYAVNIGCVEDYSNSKVTVRGMKRPIVVKDPYKNEADSHFCVIAYK